MIASPVPAAVPPHEPVNHCVTAPDPLEPPSTVNVVLPPLQIVVVPVAPIGDVETVLIVTVTSAQAVVLQSPV